MRKILKKELRLSASVLSYLFILFGLMFFIPGYPILCGAFFVTFGIFQSFQNSRETNDITFSALLPFAKSDIVRGKYLFACMIELGGFLLMCAAAAVRMTLLSESAVYRGNALMNANPFALGMALLIFGLFNLIFIGGFFRTAYKLSGPFVKYLIAAFAVIVIGESVHHFPGLEAVNAFGFAHPVLQSVLFAAGILGYLLLTWFSLRNACRSFERIDL